MAPTRQAVPTLAPEVAMSIPETPLEMTAGAMFFAPTAGIRTRIVQSYLNGQSWDVNDLGTNAGHLQGTAWVNGPGNVVLAGHAEIFSGEQGIFSTINDLKVGDPLIITQNGEQFLYNVVESRYVEPNDLTPFFPTDKPRLTLTTCSDYDFLQNSYQSRFVVIAELA
ncbi:MAG: sortase [Anaerolineae bacterium]|nr:sortase [Anaerolineae bacterium]